MEAQDILTAVHQLEETGMSRSQSEAIASTISAAVAPLATKADLEELTQTLITHVDDKIDTRFDGMRESNDGRFEGMNKSIEAQFKGMNKTIDAKFEGMNNAIDAKFEGMNNAIDAKFEGMDKAIDAKFEGMIKLINAKFDGMIKSNEAMFDSFRESMATKADIERVKVWLLSALLASGTSFAILAFRIFA